MKTRLMVAGAVLGCVATSVVQSACTLACKEDFRAYMYLDELDDPWCRVFQDDMNDWIIAKDPVIYDVTGWLASVDYEDRQWNICGECCDPISGLSNPLQCDGYTVQYDDPDGSESMAWCMGPSS